ncbi:hypothetical protein V8F06_012277 [Rhypophila decipiens]
MAVVLGPTMILIPADLDAAVASTFVSQSWPVHQYQTPSVVKTLRHTKFYSPEERLAYLEGWVEGMQFHEARIVAKRARWIQLCQSTCWILLGCLVLIYLILRLWGDIKNAE